MKIENLDHLGLVAGMVDEVGLVELTNAQLGQHQLEHISAGQVVKALILNGLGFVSAPLYLFSEFFESKPVEHLLGEGIQASYLNDDRLGRVLDELYEEGTSSFFLRVAMQAVERFGVDVGQVHLDSSSFSLQGEYGRERVESGDLDQVPIEICRGYSRDQRPDLKQFVVNLMCSADGGVPLWLKVADGNQSDAQQFAGLMRQFANSWQMDSVFVIDAAFYSEPNLQQVGSLKWVSRVPQTLSDAQALVQSDTSELTPVACTLKDYRMWETTAEYGGVQQRWILIESLTRKADQSLWEPELKQLEKRLHRNLKQLQQQVFACKPDALEALMRFQDTLAVHHLTEVSVETLRPKRAPGQRTKAKAKDTPPATGYRLKAKLERRSTAYQNQRSRFILATNHLDTQQWPADKLLQEYKGQQKTERGFRFLKDPLFFASSLFVKKAQRVEALALVMALTLMVYTLAERKLRQTLAAQQQTILDQKKQPTVNPTFRWVIQKFQGIHFVQFGHLKQISNLTDERRTIIRFLGAHVEPYYAPT
ncbi:IS1634 family transposase [Sphaerothrix gracilis]|uniref:IS1634 family transposase n=1 Tax=Sphaerothrix gracilis TaxID=3151835 RepID=UPI0031FE2F0C